MRQTDGDTSARLVYRSALYLVLGGTVLLIGGWFLVTALSRLDDPGARVGAGALLVGGVLVFATTLRPAVLADQRQVLIRNPFRSVSVPWSRVTAFTLRYSLDVDTDDRSYSCWAIPRPGRREVLGSQGMRPTHTPFARQAVEELTLWWEQRRGADAGDGEEVQVAWSRPMLAALAVAVLVLVVALATR